MKKSNIIPITIIMIGLSVGAISTLVKEFYIKLRYKGKGRPPGDGLQDEQYYNSSSYGENDEAYTAEYTGR